MSRKKSHTHQYTRIYPYAFGVSPIDKSRGVWACNLPDCTHYMPFNVANQVEGKLSLCNRCMDPFVLDSENMKDDKPLCTTCRAGVEYVAPDDFDFERYEARSKIAEKTGKALDEVTEEEIDKLIRFKRLDKI